MGKNIQIVLSNKVFYTLILIGILIIVAWGVIAYTTDGSGDPTIMGHSADELEINISGTVTTLQEAIDDGDLGSSGSSFRGALTNNSIDQIVADNINVYLNWDSEFYDTDNIHDNVVDNSRLTVPAGANKIRLIGAIKFSTNDVGFRVLYMVKNSASFPYMTPFVDTQISASQAGGGTSLNLVSPVVEVVPGDFFELVAYQTSGGNLVARAHGSWFAMEIIE